MLPSGPVAIPYGAAPALMPLANSVTVPAGVMRPMRFPPDSVNHRLPSGPDVICSGERPVALPNSVTVPARVMRPIRSALSSVNQRLPSGPAAIPTGRALREMPAANSVITPAGVIRPMRPTPGKGRTVNGSGNWPLSANHMFPSGPAVMPVAKAPKVMVANSVTIPAGVIRPMRETLSPPPLSVNHMFPSGPLAIPFGPEAGVMPLANSVITPAGVTRPIRLALPSVNQRLPSGPAAILPTHALPPVIPLANSVTAPLGVIRPMRSPQFSVNQRLPSGPAAIAISSLLNAVGVLMPLENSVIAPASTLGAPEMLGSGGGDAAPPLQPASSVTKAKTAKDRISRCSLGPQGHRVGS